MHWRTEMLFFACVQQAASATAYLQSISLYGTTMKITREEVEKTARLARLELNSEEIGRITAQLDNILSYVAKLDELETSGVPAETHLFGAANAFREDEVRPSLPREAALANSACHDDAAFVVPRVIG